MKSFQIVTLACLFAATMAFAPNKAPQGESVSNCVKAAIASIPVATLAAPAFAFDSIVGSLPTQTLSLEVQFGAYLAVLLGTLLPVLFLINLYTQSESRRAGKDGGQDSS
ncbi:hypothetical protein ACHAXA_010788 [Cyclostephanos tholiformis]|uniref:Photosystem II reaction center M protein n=1 Tax=Cyclostephanos tholiformis TaxID=382380 RepID=A0ABD3RST5_9STRA